MGDEKEGLQFVFPGVETALCWPDQGIRCLLLLSMVWSEELLSYIQIFPKRAVCHSEQYSFVLMSKWCVLLLLCMINMRCTCWGEVPSGARGTPAEVGGFFPGFPSPRGACYFWCLVYPRQNKIYVFQVIAVLFGGSRSWFNVGA